MSGYKDHEFFEQVDDSPIQFKTKNLFWQLSDEDMEAEEKHWNLIHAQRGVGNRGVGDHGDEN